MKKIIFLGLVLLIAFLVINKVYFLKGFHYDLIKIESQKYNYLFKDSIRNDIKIVWSQGNKYDTFCYAEYNEQNTIAIWDIGRYSNCDIADFNVIKVKHRREYAFDILEIPGINLRYVIKGKSQRSNDLNILINEQSEVLYEKVGENYHYFNIINNGFGLSSNKSRNEVFLKNEEDKEHLNVLMLSKNDKFFLIVMFKNGDVDLINNELLKIIDLEFL